MTAVAQASLAQGRQRKRARNSRAKRETLSFYLFISPWIFGFVFLEVIPLLVGLASSLTNFSGLFDPKTLKWVGAANYVRAFQDPDAVWGLQRTGVYTAFTVPMGLLLAFFLAVLLSQKVRARGFFGVCYYIPGVVPIVGSSWIWRLLMDKNFGLVNAAVSAIWPGRAINWLSSYPMQVLWVLSLWAGIGGSVVIFLAALQSVPRELQEAALIDGAGSFQEFRYVTAPLVTPVIFYQFVTGIIGSLQTAIAPILLAGVKVGGIPPRGSYTYMVHVIRQNFSLSRFGYAAALVWLLFVLILALTLVVFRTQRYWVFYEFEQEGGKAK